MLISKQYTRAFTRGGSAHRLEGYTLIELLIVALIIAILAGIAIPGYRSYVMRTNRTDARRVLTVNAQVLQRCYSQNFTYAGCATPLAAASPNGSYNVATVINAQTYTLTATPAGTQANDTKCASFTIDQTGKTSATDSGGADQSQTCWGGT